MKKLISFLLSAVMTAVSAVLPFTAQAKESYKDIFKKDRVIDINIDINEADLNDMNEYAQNEEYHSADVTVDGIKVENAGIRTKGNMTLKSMTNSDSDRYSFRIKFDKYVKNQTLLGMDELCLNNGYSDPSYMREYLHYEILREMGMNVPETAFCNVYINGELFGFYLAVEGLDDSFLEREFGEDYKDGNFYKMDEGATLEYREDENYSYADLKSGDDNNLESFKYFVKRLNNIKDGEKGDIESFLNVDSALKYIASNTVLSNYDSYNGNMHHNYYLYEDKNGVFTVVPWDFNMSFGGFGGSNTDIGIDTPCTSGNISELPLIEKLLSVDEYKEKYYGYIKDMMEILESFEDRVNEIKEIIKPYVEKDPTAFYTAEEFEKATTASENTSSADNGKREKSRGFGGSSIIDCVNDRLENLKAQFNGTADKTTQQKGDRRGKGEPQGGGQPPQRPGDENGKMTPPNGENPMPPVGIEPPNGDRITPPDDEKTEQPEGFEPPNGDKMTPPEGFNPQNDKNGVRPNNRSDGKKNENSVIRVHVNGHIVSFAENPVIENSSTLVGCRSVMEALGAEVSWNEENQTVTAEKDGEKVVFTVGSDTAYVNGEEKKLSAAPEIRGDSTMIPIRFIAEQLGMKVSWEESTKLITVVSGRQ